MSRLLRLGAAVPLAAAGFVLAALYPLAPAILSAALAGYAVALWRWPWLWLVVIPAMLPNLDLSPWTGWLLTQEPDAFILVTLAVLLARGEASRADLRLTPVPTAILGLFAVTLLVSAGIGLAAPGAVGGSAIVYLTPANTPRVGKAAVYALALLPFLRARQRVAGDAVALLGAGMLLGLVGVVILVAVERAVFVGLWNFGADYRVSAAFASMHVGGGHIGAWLAMALPFLAMPLLRWRARWWPFAGLLALGGGYALVVTFARTAYAATVAAALVTASGLVLAGFRGARWLLGRRLAPAVLLLGVGGAVLVASASAYMSSRFAGTRGDLAVRETNWLRGMQVRDEGMFALLFGSGLGAYPRLWFDRAPPLRRQSNFRLGREGETGFVTLLGRMPTYFVQKTPARTGQALRLEFRLRGKTAGATLSTGVCLKWLLYSLDCATATRQVPVPDMWEDVRVPLTVPVRPDGRAPPVELFLSVAPGAVADVTALRLLDETGTDLLRNGDFAEGTTYWFFTDDNHVLWRIFNQYLSLYFEGGLLGSFAFVLLLAGAGAGCLRTLGQGSLERGEPLAACLAGALAAFAVSCLFDAPLEAPRVGLTFYLIAFAALATGLDQQEDPQ